MKKDPLRVCVVSDIHLAHRRTPTIEIADSLRKQITSQNISRTDVLFIPGDLFDRHLALPNQEVFEIHSLINYLLALCSRYSVVLRVLEGTPSHDWKQSRLLESINEAAHGTDAKHISTLSIEHIDSLGIDVLYVPDEWDSDPMQTQKQVQELLDSRGISQVDFSIMHGQFEYQLPPQLQAPRHDSEFYEAITRHYVFIGHIHTPSHRGRIIAPGSFSRLAHGEEHAKGHWELIVREHGDDEINFIENPYAKIYTSIDLTGLDSEQALSVLDERMASLPPDSHVRLIADKADPIADSMEALKRRYPHQNCTHRLQGSVTRSLEAIEDMRARSNSVAITPESVYDLTDAKLQQITQDATVRNAALSKLEELRHGVNR